MTQCSMYLVHWNSRNVKHKYLTKIYVLNIWALLRHANIQILLLSYRTSNNVGVWCETKQEISLVCLSRRMSTGSTIRYNLTTYDILHEVI